MIARLGHEGKISCYYGCEFFGNYAMCVGREVFCLHLQSSDVGSSGTLIPVNLTAKYWLSYAVPISFCHLIPILFTHENKTNNQNADMFENRPVPYTHYKLGRYGTQILDLREILGSPKMPRAW